MDCWGICGGLRTAAAVSAVLVFATPTHVRADAMPSKALVDDALLERLRSAVEVPVATISVEAQNARTSGLSQSEVYALDREWRQQREAENQPIVAELLGSPLSAYLMYVQAAFVGLITEIIVMDARGLNVGQSALTSDYWQGDEAKFTRTVPRGAAAVFVDEVSYHRETGTWRCQASLTLSGSNGMVIGAATFEINLNELARLRALKAESH